MFERTLPDENSELWVINCSTSAKVGHISGPKTVPLLLTSDMYGHTMNKRYSYYRCPNMLKTNKNPVTCGQRYVRMNELDEVVWISVKTILSDPELVVEEMRRAESDSTPKFEQEITDIKGGLSNAKGREYQVLRLFELDELDEGMITDRLAEIRQEQQNLDDDLTRTRGELNAAQRIKTGADHIEALVGQVANRLDDADYDLKRLALEALQIRVTVQRDRIDLAGAIPLSDEVESNIGHHWTNIGMTTCV